jgi:hypothetical protein
MTPNTSNSCLLYVTFSAETEDRELGVLGLVAATLAIGTAIRDTDHTQNACPLPHVPSKDTHKGNEDSFLAGCDAVSSSVSRRFDETWYLHPQELGVHPT